MVKKIGWKIIYIFKVWKVKSIPFSLSLKIFIFSFFIFSMKTHRVLT